MQTHTPKTHLILWPPGGLTLCVRCVQSPKAQPFADVAQSQLRLRTQIPLPLPIVS
jgi:hypothetical protein